MLKHRPLAVIPGTGVHRLAAPIAYRQFLDLSPISECFPLTWYGLAHSRDSARDISPRIAELFNGCRGDIIGDSQGGYPAIQYAYDHPWEVEYLVLLSVPLDGTPVARRASRFIDLPGIRCMWPGSRYVEEIREKAKELADNPNGPKIICISSGHDYLVPSHSAYLHSDSPRVFNYCLHHERPKGLHALVEHVPVRDGRVRNHILELWLRDTGRFIGGKMGYIPEAEANFGLEPVLVAA